MDIRQDFLEQNCFYHIYNRGINGCTVFNDNENRYYFLRKVKEYLLDYIEVFAYCLMPNHFHLVIKVKDKTSIPSSNLKGLHSEDSVVSKQVGKLISSYTQAFNKRFDRHGSLFERPFKRKKILDESYLRQVIVYVNRNPLDIQQKIEEYLFSSYKSILSTSPTSVARNEVLLLFEGIENFKYCHKKESLYRFELE